MILTTFHLLVYLFTCSHGNFYYIVSLETNYEPLSESSLWRILRAIKPSQRRSLAGLDDVTASGMNGFTTLQSLARRFNENEIVASLEQSKRYLKTRYQIHCSDSQTQITSHCAKFALSDPTDKRLISETDVSEEVCPECFELCKTIQKVEDIAKENCVDDDTMYDLKMAVSDIFNLHKAPDERFTGKASKD